jgi:cellobiose epimerase
MLGPAEKTPTTRLIASMVENPRRAAFLYPIMKAARTTILNLLRRSGLNPLDGDGAIPASSPAAYRHLADEVEANLRSQVLAKWFPAALDTARGGYHQNFREDWTRAPRNDRALVYQARLSWLTAQAATRFPEQAHVYKDYSRHGLDFLEQQLWDREQGGFWWALDENGTPERQGEKHVYGIAFGIFAASECYRATHEPHALALAKRAYAWLDAHAYDKQHGGYYEALTREGKPVLSPPNPAMQSDLIGTYYGYKSMNTHIHLLEALIGLYAVWPDGGVRHRLQEVFTLVRDRIAVAPGCLNMFFTPDWRPVPDHDSFGHDVETAYLLVEASTALGKPDDANTWGTARQLVDHALEYGWDRENGGFYDAGTAFGPPLVTDKIWWTQAEGLNTLSLMHARYGRETPRYWNALNRQWQFIRHCQVDARNGGWYATVRREGAPIPGQLKSDRWTEAYHQGRALLLVSKELRRLAGPRPGE